MSERGSRGPHPEDAHDFGPDALAGLRAAVDDLSELLGRGYRSDAALTLVGDHHQLVSRQRHAVRRSSCAALACRDRRDRCVAVRGDVAVDGFNLLITLERALSEGPVLLGRDGAMRDLASVHGTWRAVRQTPEAIELAAVGLAPATRCRWLLDRPVSNSGRLAAALRGFAELQALPWEVEVVDQPDAALIAWPGVVVSSDAGVLDRCGAWASVAAEVVARLPGAWVVDLRGSPA